MSETPACEVVIGDLHNEFWRQRHPFAGTFCAPSAWPSGRAAGESGWFNEELELTCKSLTL